MAGKTAAFVATKRAVRRSRAPAARLLQVAEPEFA
jgi:hypothetical protein